MSLFESESEHPTNEELASYKSRHSLQKLSKEKEQDIEMHLSWCTECQEIKQILEEMDDRIDGVLTDKCLDIILTQEDKALTARIVHNIIQQDFFEEKDFVLKKKEINLAFTAKFGSDQISPESTSKPIHNYNKKLRVYRLLAIAASVFGLVVVYNWQQKPTTPLPKTNDNSAEIASNKTNINTSTDISAQNPNTEPKQIVTQPVDKKVKTTFTNKNLLRNNEIKNLEQAKYLKRTPHEKILQKEIVPNEKLLTNRQQAQLRNSIFFGKGKSPAEKATVLPDGVARETLASLKINQEQKHNDSFRGASNEFNPENINFTGLFLKTLDDQPINPVVQQLLERVKREHSLVSLPIVTEKAPMVITIIIFVDDSDEKAQLKYQAFYDNQPIISERVLGFVSNNINDTNEVSALFIKSLTKSLAFLLKKSKKASSNITPH